MQGPPRLSSSSSDHPRSSYEETDSCSAEGGAIGRLSQTSSEEEAALSARQSVASSSSSSDVFLGATGGFDEPDRAIVIPSNPGLYGIKKQEIFTVKKKTRTQLQEEVKKLKALQEEKSKMIAKGPIYSYFSYCISHKYKFNMGFQNAFQQESRKAGIKSKHHSRKTPSHILKTLGHAQVSYMTFLLLSLEKTEKDLIESTRKGSDTDSDTSIKKVISDPKMIMACQFAKDIDLMRKALSSHDVILNKLEKTKDEAYIFTHGDQLDELDKRLIESKTELDIAKNNLLSTEHEKYNPSVLDVAKQEEIDTIKSEIRKIKLNLEETDFYKQQSLVRQQQKTVFLLEDRLEKEKEKLKKERNNEELKLSFQCRLTEVSEEKQNLSFLREEMHRIKKENHKEISFLESKLKAYELKLGDLHRKSKQETESDLIRSQISDLEHQITATELDIHMEQDIKSFIEKCKYPDYEHAKQETKLLASEIEKQNHDIKKLEQKIHSKAIHIQSLLSEKISLLRDMEKDCLIKIDLDQEELKKLSTELNGRLSECRKARLEEAKKLKEIKTKKIEAVKNANQEEQDKQSKNFKENEQRQENLSQEENRLCSIIHLISILTTLETSSRLSEINISQSVKEESSWIKSVRKPRKTQRDRYSSSESDEVTKTRTRSLDRHHRSRITLSGLGHAAKQPSTSEESNDSSSTEKEKPHPERFHPIYRRLRSISTMGPKKDTTGSSTDE